MSLLDSARAAPNDPVIQRDKRGDTKKRDAIYRELQRVTGQLAKTKPDSPSYEALLRRQEALDRKLTGLAEAEPATTPATIDARGPLSRARAMVAFGEGTERRLLTFVGDAATSLQATESRIVEYLDNYESAYGTFAETLEQAKKDAALREAIIGALVGIVIGTGVGLAAGAVFEAAKGASKVFVEIGGEVIEWVAGKAAQKSYESEGQFSAPLSMRPEVHASAAWKQLAKAWKGMALLNGPIIQFEQALRALDRMRGELESLATGGGAPHTVREYSDALDALDKSGTTTRISSKITELEGALGLFVAVSNTPVLERGPWKLEQDIWIAWISGLLKKGLSPDQERLYESVSDTVYDSLDEDAVEDRLHELGVLGKRSRLRTSFGGWTSRGDTWTAFQRARVEQGLIKQLGRMAVVVSLVASEHGAVRMRPDAYAKVRRQNPDPSAPQDYYPATSWRGQQLLKGQVGLIRDIDSGRLVIESLDPWMQPLSVTAEESKAAEKFDNY